MAPEHALRVGCSSKIAWAAGTQCRGQGRGSGHHRQGQRWDRPGPQRIGRGLHLRTHREALLPQARSPAAHCPAQRPAAQVQHAPGAARGNLEGDVASSHLDAAWAMLKTMLEKMGIRI